MAIGIFVIGEKFANRYNLQLIPDPYIADLEQHTILLTHGDLLCTDDKDYIAVQRTS